MEIRTHHTQSDKIAEVQSDAILIQSNEDGLDLLGNLYFQGFDKVILHEENINSDFFNLENGMAGEILQKFSNYRVRLVIVGDYSKFTRKSITDFIYESNNGKHVNFLSTIDEALNALS